MKTSIRIFAIIGIVLSVIFAFVFFKTANISDADLQAAAQELVNQGQYTASEIDEAMAYIGEVKKVYAVLGVLCILSVVMKAASLIVVGVCQFNKVPYTIVGVLDILTLGLITGILMLCTKVETPYSSYSYTVNNNDIE